VVNKRGLRRKTKCCIKMIWTEKVADIVERQVLIERAGAEVARQVGQLCRSVGSMANEVVLVGPRPAIRSCRFLQPIPMSLCLIILRLNNTFLSWEKVREDP
jgi:hypothetical protein